MIWRDHTSSSSGRPAGSGLTGASLLDVAPSAAQKSLSARDDPNALSSSIVLTRLALEQPSSFLCRMEAAISADLSI